MRKFKRLNRKGFTLIELLAVIVILAVVMGIATNSVLSSMNNARGGALVDSAQVIARGLDQRLMAAQAMGQNKLPGFTGLTIGTSGVYYIPAAVGKEYGLENADYRWNSTTTAVAVDNADTRVNDSFIYYNANGTFVVCLFAKSGGKNYVAGYRAPTAASGAAGTTVYTVASGKVVTTSAQMFACSNGTKSWTA